MMAIIGKEEEEFPGEKTSAEMELEKILSNKRKVTYRGRSKYFGDEKTKMNQRVNKSIKRAIDHIRVEDEYAYKHFLKAFRPIKRTWKQYNPPEPLPWKLE